MRILITGGRGFIGRHICKLCERDGNEFVALIRNDICELNEIKVDLLNRTEIDKAVNIIDPDVVIHLAALAAPVHNDILELYATNVVGTANLFDSLSQNAKNCKRVIVVSTAGVYGNQKPLYLSEDLPTYPVNHYSYSKLVDENLINQYKNRFEVVIARPFTVVGKGQSESFFVPKVVKAYKERVKELHVGNLKAVRDYVDVEYVAKAIYKMATVNEIIYDKLNICSGIANSCEQVLMLLSEITGHKPQIISDDQYVRNNEIWRLVGDPGRVESFINNDFSYKNLKNVLIEMLE